MNEATGKTVHTGMTRKPIYLDNQATTAVDPRVLEAMMPFFTECYGNPHSQSHSYGREAAAAVERARGQVAALIGAEPREIVFTSGATEANNLAIKGAAQFHRGKKNHIVTLETEHKCVLESCRWLEQQGFAVTYLPVARNGLVKPKTVGAALTAETVLVSIMAAHNEIGVIQPIAEIGALCRAAGVLFHSDCAQAAGKIPLDVGMMKIDLLSISAHKMYGPKGVGALFVRRRPRARIAAQMSGGGQERTLRSGTVAPALCVGLGQACAIADAALGEESSRLRALRDRLLNGLSHALPDLVVNGDMEDRLPGNLNVSFLGVDAEDLMTLMPEIAVSTGSACTSAAVEPSYVLQATGVGEAVARSSIRFGVGRFTTQAEVDAVIASVVRAVNTIRSDAVSNTASHAVLSGS